MHNRIRIDEAAGPGLAFGGMLALAAGMGIGRFAYTPILPAMVAGLGFSKTAAGLIASANFLGYLAGALLAALPLLPGGRRRLFLAALVLGAVTTAAMAGTASLPMFLALRFLGGVASAFVLVLGSALVLDRLARAGRSPLAGLHFAGVGIGIAVSAVLVEVLRADGAGWRALWLACGVVSALVIPPVALLVPGGDATASSHAPASAPGPRGLGTVALCHGLFGFGYVATATFLLAIIRGSPGHGLAEMLIWLATGLAAAPSTAFWGGVGARIGVLRAYALAALVEAAGVTLGGLWPTPAGAFITAILLGGTIMGLTALGFTAAQAIAPAAQRRAFALITAGFGVGQIIGPVIAGWLLDRTGSFAPPSLLAAAALLLASWLAARLASRLRQEAA